MSKRTLNPAQEELPLSSINVSDVFCGRKALYVWEVKLILSCSEQQVVDLIKEWIDTAGKSGLEGFNIGNTAGNKTPRAAWRVPVVGLQNFLNQRTAGDAASAKSQVASAK